MTAFSLLPFTPQGQPPIALNGQALRDVSRLTLDYHLTGDLTALKMAESAPYPQRQDHLWQTTCFEFFLGVPGRSDYWEFNLSPAGHWNGYGFTNYRQGMTTELAFAALPFTVLSQDQDFHLSLTLDLALLKLADLPWELAIATVVETKAGNLSYWALTHPRTAADFHCRESFILSLPAP